MSKIADYEEIHFNHTSKRLDQPSSYLIRKAKLAKQQETYQQKQQNYRSMTDSIFGDAAGSTTDEEANKPEPGLEQLTKSMTSKTIYVGNLTEYTKEEQIYELFSEVGSVESVIMGLDRFKFTPCGFAFVIFDDMESCFNAVKFTKGAVLVGNKISVDLDPGFENGREFGRGTSGGQRTREDYIKMKKFVSDSRRYGGQTNVYIPSKK